MSRRLFLRRAASSVGVVALLPVIGSKVFARGAASPTMRATQYFEHTILAMGTTVRVGVYSDSEAHANQAINKAFAEVKRLEKLLSIYDPTSEVSKINASAGTNEVLVTIDTFEIAALSLGFAGLTNGAFDATVEPLMRLWGFREENEALRTLPTDSEIAQTLPHVGSHVIELDQQRHAVRLNDPLARLDFGGIAAGYALDRMGTILRDEGVTSAFLDISGDVLTIGAPPNKSGWEVSVPDPRDTSRLLHTTHLRDEALATSGSYMNYVVYAAKEYGHILDPKAGYPAHSVLSATAIHRSGVSVDALSTAAFASGTAHGDARFVFVRENGAVESI